MKTVRERLKVIEEHLKLVSKKPRSIKLRLSAGYDAQVFKDKIVVGCQTFPIGVVEAILRASKELQ